MAIARTDELRGAPQPGEIFAGKYRVEHVLGAGGMGYVLAATHLQLGERVALKMLLPSLVSDADTVARFLREARAAIRIKSEHCVRVQDVGELPDHTPYMVMEYLDGMDLAAALRERGRLPVSLAVDWVLEACEAIAEAHALRIVHRDLKPSNLFVQRIMNGGETIKVLDFGISKMHGTEEGHLVTTRTSTMMGSPLYMSPEQLKNSKNVDQRTDQWALGVILFELVAGSPPFNADTLAELGAAVLSGEAPWLGSRAPDAPPALSEIVATCLRKSAADRYVNLAGLAEALAPLGTSKAQHSKARIVEMLGGVPPPPPRSSATSLGEGAMTTSALAATVDGSSMNQNAPAWGAITPPPGASTASQARTSSVAMLVGVAAFAVFAVSVAAAGLFLVLRRPKPAAVADAPTIVLPAPFSSAPPVSDTVAPVPGPSGSASSAPAPSARPALAPTSRVGAPRPAATGKPPIATAAAPTPPPQPTAEHALSPKD